MVRDTNGRPFYRRPAFGIGCGILVLLLLCGGGMWLVNSAPAMLADVSSGNFATRWAVASYATPSSTPRPPKNVRSDNNEGADANGAANQVQLQVQLQVTATPNGGRESMLQAVEMPELRSVCSYTVRAGDSLYGIALASDTTVAELARVNNIVGSTITVGQTIILPNCDTQETEDAAEQEVPVLDEEQSWAPEVEFGSFDLGVNEGQIGLVFGVHVRWPQGSLDAGGSDCDFVVLNPGFYPDLQIMDGRYEVYTLPSRDQNGWITVLAEQRAAEQAQHYLCPSGMGHVQVWSADPFSTSWDDRRQASGVDYLIPFQAGDTVFGYYIQLENGTYCDGGECRLDSAPTAGMVGGGTVNTWWAGEIAQAAAAPLWNGATTRPNR